jgi:hypothetical protein
MVLQHTPERCGHHSGMTSLLAPPITSPDTLTDTLRSQGHAALSPSGLAQLACLELDSLAAWLPSWERLPPDAYLRDGGRYRRRRHGSFVATGTSLLQVPHRAHWQPVSYNALHGGLERWFEPLVEAVVGIFLAHEAVAFVLGAQVPHRRAVGAHRGHDLLGLGVGHARVVAALHHEQRLADALGVVSGEMRSRKARIAGSRSSPYSARRRSRR